MIALLVISGCLALSALLTELAWRRLNPPEPKREPCAHPWYIDGRCMVCGQPKE